MKHYLLFVLLVVLSLNGTAQRLMLNAKAPKIDFSEVVYGTEPVNGKPLYIEFVTEHMSGLEDHLNALAVAAEKYADKIQFVVIYKGDVEVLEKIGLTKDGIPYAVLVDDDEKFFEYYDVRYTPKSVVLDEKGKFIWQGKLNHSDAILETL